MYNLVVKTWARGHYDIKYRVPRASVFYMSYCPSIHVLTGIASIANALYIIKLLYKSTISMVMDAILLYYVLYVYVLLTYNSFYGGKNAPIRLAAVIWCMGAAIQAWVLLALMI